jgi:hypothetical protein
MIHGFRSPQRLPNSADHVTSETSRHRREPLPFTAKPDANLKAAGSVKSLHRVICSRAFWGGGQRECLTRMTIERWGDAEARLQRAVVCSSGSLLRRLERAFDPFAGNQTAHGIVAVLTDVALAALLAPIVGELHGLAAAPTRLPYRKSRRHWTVPIHHSIVHPDGRVSTHSREERSWHARPVPRDTRTALLSSAPHRRRAAERASADPLQVVDLGLAVRRGFEKFRSDMRAGAGLPALLPLASWAVQNQDVCTDRFRVMSAR